MVSSSRFRFREALIHSHGRVGVLVVSSDASSRAVTRGTPLMATKVSERQRKAFECKIEGADKVEIKITVTEGDQSRAYQVLDIDRSDAARRAIYFFGTPELALYQAGVVLRARDIEDDDHDSVVKIRRVDPEQVDDKWKEANGFKLEADTVGAKVVISASLKVAQKKKAIDKVADGKDAISDLFSKKQAEFLAEFYDGPLGIDDLTVLGPVKTLRTDIERPGMAYPLTAEHWILPDETPLLELSIKCPPEEAVVAREVFQAFLAGHGLDPNGAQATKTKLALMGLAKRIAQG